MNKALSVALSMVSLWCMAGDEKLVGFDFCGIPRMAGVVSNGEVSAAADDLPLEYHQFLSDVARVNAQGYAFVFQSALSLAEFRAGMGDGESYGRGMEYAGKMLRLLMADSEIVGKSAFDCNYARTANSIARIVNGGQGRKVMPTARDIRRWLPKIEGRTDRDATCLMRFRTLLVLGAAIEWYRTVHTHLPESLWQLVEERGLGITAEDLAYGGMEVEYWKNPGFWKLRVGSGRRLKEAPLYDFVPEFYQVAGIFADEVWFVSTYTQKRVELFRRGCLASEDVLCRCRLKGCIVVRGGAKVKNAQ